MDDTTACTQNRRLPAAAGSEPGPRAEPDQPRLPLASFDDEADEPIGYRLTARARRAVAPHAVPELRVVAAPPSPGEDAGLDRPGDTRPSRARALRRGGSTLLEIAEVLGVDELVVRAWVGDVGARRGRRGATVDRGSSGDPGPPSGTTGEADGVGDGSGVAFELARASARDESAARLSDASFAAGLGIVSAIATVDEHSATLTSSRIAVAASAVRWLREALGAEVTQQLRVVLRLGPDIAGDLARHRWAAAMGLPAERVLHTRWRGAPAGDAVEALIRLPDPSSTARLAGWCDGLLDVPGTAGTHDTGF